MIINQLYNRIVREEILPETSWNTPPFKDLVVKKRSELPIQGLQEDNLIKRCSTAEALVSDVGTVDYVTRDTLAATPPHHYDRVTKISCFQFAG